MSSIYHLVVGLAEDKETLGEIRTLHNLANDFYRANDFDRAIEHYTKALEINPKLVETYFNRGLAHTRKLDYENAVSDFTVVLELNPNVAEAYYTRGLIYEYTQEYELAIKDYKRALEINPAYKKAKEQLDATLKKRKSVSG